MPRRALLLIIFAAACASEPEPDRLASPVEVCAAGETVDGIDVSYWQGTIDWSQVAASGIDFAIIRASHGLGVIDTKFDANWAGAKQHGIIRGAYQYFEPDDDPLAQAELFLELMGPLEPGDLPPVIDVEEAGSLTPAELAAAVGIWIDHVEGAIGRPPMIYAGKYFWRDHVGSLDFADNPFWIAQWGVTCPDLPAPWTDWAFHQTSATGSIPGISGNVDTDLFNGSLEDLVAFAAGEPPEPPPPCDPIPAAGRVVDDAESCFEAGGSPSSIRTVRDEGWGGRLLWTFTTDWAQADNYGRWNLDVSEGGRYRVEAHTPAPWGESRAAAYQVAHAGAIDTVVVDQTANDGWAALGDFDFAAGGDQFVRVDDNTGEALATQTQLVFDAIRLTRVEAIPLDPPGHPDRDGVNEPVQGVSCAAAPGARGGGAAGLVLAALCIVFSRRRSASTIR